jgi:hypothetical protein
MRRSLVLRIKKPLLIFAFVALLPVLTYPLWGYIGDDLHEHLTSWMELARFWKSGQLLPYWAEKANFTLGDPRFSFYPPVSFAVGASLALFLPLRFVPAAYVWLVFVASGCSIYYASRPFVPEEDRLKVAVLYMVNPYLILTSVVRFAAAELLTQVWLPLVFLFFYQSLWRKERRATLLLGCMLAVCWITNVPGAIVLLYGLLATAGIIAVRQKSAWPLVSFCVAEAIAAALAAFYLAPVWSEQAWIHKDTVFRFGLGFLFWPLFHLMRPAFTMSLWAYACFETGLVAIYAWYWRKQRAQDEAARTWLEIALVSFVFQLPITSVLWRHLPQLRFADFPFRFLAATGAALPLALFARDTPRSLRKPTYVIVALLALLPYAMFLRARYSPRQPPSFASIVNGWEERGYQSRWPEFVPVGAKPPAPVNFPPSSPVSPATSSGCATALRSPRPGRKILETNASGPCQVRIAMYYYPYWQAIDESGTHLETGRDADGLLLVRVPAGEHTIRLVFEARSFVRTGSLMLSLLSLLVVFLTIRCSPQAGRGVHFGADDEIAI